MLLDTGTLIGIVIALAGSCFVMVISIRAQGQLHRTINLKNQHIRSLQGQLHEQKRSQINEGR